MDQFLVAVAVRKNFIQQRGTLNEAGFERTPVILC
jgi:hypothetical protein